MEIMSMHPVERSCREQYSKLYITRILERCGVPGSTFEGVCFADTGETASAFAVMCALAPYVKQNGTPEFLEEADKIAASLKRFQLEEAIERAAECCDLVANPAMLRPISRYGSGKEISKLISKIRKWDKQPGKERKAAQSARDALLLSDTREALLYIDKIQWLDSYAKIRGVTAQELRDWVLLDFGFDKDDVKRLDLGSTVIEIRIDSRLNFQLYDTVAGKTVKSLPKRNADPEMYAACSAELKDLKNNAKKVLKEQAKHLQRAYIEKTEMDVSYWKSLYLDNPVLGALARLLLWQWEGEGEPVRFLLTPDKNVLGCTGAQTGIGDTGRICLAHPMELPPEELEQWRVLLGEMKLPQPFTQVFEPVYDIPENAIPDRYKGMEMPLFVLKNLEKEGFTLEREWNSMEITGNAVYVYYKSDEVPESEYGYVPIDSIVSLGRLFVKETGRGLNHDLYALDTALLGNRVRENDLKALETFAPAITAGNIRKLIDIAIETQSLDCQSWLMNYQNEHFPMTWDDLELLEL